jgi:hypothetical protein
MAWHSYATSLPSTAVNAASVSILAKLRGALKAACSGNNCAARMRPALAKAWWSALTASVCYHTLTRMGHEAAQRTLRQALKCDCRNHLDAVAAQFCTSLARSRIGRSRPLRVV